MEQHEKPLLNKRIFWDVDADKMDYQKKAAFVIERVFERGDVPDIRNCRRFYGDEKVKEVLLNAKWLGQNTIALACAIFDNQPTDYRCYNLAQLNHTHMMN